VIKFSFDFAHDLEAEITGQSNERAKKYFSKHISTYVVLTGLMFQF
jgi:hypothetical protein